jgi:RND family efflux transporter MFP subunit
LKEIWSRWATPAINRQRDVHVLVRDLAAVAIAAAALLALSEDSASAQEGPPDPVEFTESQVVTVGAKLELPGSVEPLRKAQVSTPVAGLVTELHAREGDLLEAGQLLAHLDVSTAEARRITLQAQLTESEARLRSATAKLKRANELFEAQVIAREQLDDSLYERDALQARSESLRASIAEIDLSISQSVIHAPFSGVVTRKLTEVGQWVKEGDPVLEILSLDELEVAVQVPEIHIRKVRLGQSARVRLEAYPKMALDGKVSVVVPEADPDARTFPVKISVSSMSGKVRAGMLATVSLAPAVPRRAVMVPKDALVDRGSSWVVFALIADNKVDARSVRRGQGIGEWVEVSGDLGPGERVITRGNERLQSGQAVKARPREYETP